MYDGAIRRYCTKDVIMCHGSNCGRLSVASAYAEVITHEDDGRHEV